jgi:hypothetical protein
MERQRRANNPDHYDDKGRIKQAGKKRVHWKESKRYSAIRRRAASTERKLAAYRKSLHGKLVHDIVRVGKTLHIEKTSYKGWQKRYGKCMGLRAPGMFLAHLRRTVAKTGGTLSARVCFSDQTVAVLSRLQALRQQAPLPALASVSLRGGAGAA